VAPLCWAGGNGAVLSGIRVLLQACSESQQPAIDPSIDQAVVAAQSLVFCGSLPAHMLNVSLQLRKEKICCCLSVNQFFGFISKSFQLASSC